MYANTLIQQSIDQLEKLSAFLAGEIGSGAAAALPVEKRVVKEALLTTTVLLPKLHAVQRAADRMVPPVRTCIACED